MEFISSISVTIDKTYIYFVCTIIHINLSYSILRRRIDDDRGKSYELGQSAIKCMRGILECWMKQSSRVELFKRNQSNRFALHCKFHLNTGDEILQDTEYHHLQVNFLY